MSIGDKIKKIRQLRGHTQGELGHMVNLGDDRIRHYELGLRTPKDDKLQEISDALGVNILALSEPNLDSYDGVMHALFYLEDNYGLKLENRNGELILKFKPDKYPFDTMTGRLENWHKAIERYKPLECDTTQDIDKKKRDYDSWRLNYPMSEAKRQAEERKKGNNIKNS